MWHTAGVTAHSYMGFILLGRHLVLPLPHLIVNRGRYAIVSATLENIILAVKIGSLSGLLPELKLLPVSTTPSWF